jgi:hypothetical protein
MSREFRLFSGLVVLLIRDNSGKTLSFYYDEKYKELYISFFKYLLILFKDKVK